jgi:glycosyltransferase involved in cell wall biosynthesis
MELFWATQFSLGVIMRVVVALEDRLFQVGSTFYSHNLNYESFWRRYLGAFDSVVALVRVIKSDSVPEGWGMVNGAGIEVAALPQYYGPYEYLLKRARIDRIILRVIQPGDAVILRVPGNIATRVWKNLTPSYPYGLEVVGDPWNSFAPGSVRGVVRPYARWSWTRNLKAQCRCAAAVAYVTEYALQKRYPPGVHTLATHCSDVALESSFLCTDTSLRLKAISTIPARLVGEVPAVRLGFVGSFSQTHKLPHVHIEAVAGCVAKGANVTLDMIGDGALLVDMKALARKLGVGNRVNFRGQLPAGKPIIEALDGFDLFLNATAAEGLSRVLVEAISRGCPCIASDIGGTPELLKPQYLVPVGDVNALTEKILRVLNDTELMAKAVNHNIVVARNYCEYVLEPRRQAFYTALRERTEKYLAKRLY